MEGGIDYTAITTVIYPDDRDTMRFHVVILDATLADAGSEVGSLGGAASALASSPRLAASPRAPGAPQSPRAGASQSPRATPKSAWQLPVEQVKKAHVVTYYDRLITDKREQISSEQGGAIGTSFNTMPSAIVGAYPEWKQHDRIVVPFGSPGPSDCITLEVYGSEVFIGSCHVPVNQYYFVSREKLVSFHEKLWFGSEPTQHELSFGLLLMNPETVLPPSDAQTELRTTLAKRSLKRWRKHAKKTGAGGTRGPGGGGGSKVSLSGIGDAASVVGQVALAVGEGALIVGSVALEILGALG